LSGIKDPMPTPVHDPKDWTWHTRFATTAEHVAALEALGQMDLPPHEAKGEGMVYVGGDIPGEPYKQYGLGVAAGIHMARWSGYHGPIEWWFDSKKETARQYDMRDLGDVRIRDIQDLNPLPRMRVGWPNKLTAIVHSAFRRVLFLDADAHLVASPDTLFSLLDEVSFVHWTKNDMRAVVARAWPHGGFGGSFGITGGQLLIDTIAARRLVVIAHWVNQHADYYYPSKTHKQAQYYLFGDEDTWPLSFAVCKHYGYVFKTRDLGKTVYSKNGCEFSHEGKTRIAHWSNNKMNSSGWHPLPESRFKCSEQAVAMRNEALRGRDRKVVGAPAQWRYQEGTTDLKRFGIIATRNEYRLPDTFEPEDVILDVGGNHGTFTHACHQRGAGRIVSVEPHPDNLVILRHNCPYSEIHEVALWSEENRDKLTLIDHSTTNTGDARLGVGGMAVTVEGFDTFVHRVRGDQPIRFLKLDCEGAEIPILMTSQRLRQVQEIACEVHTEASQWDMIIKAIRGRLSDEGFSIITEVEQFKGQGLIFAKRGN
jgi:FkbM family methyltransferase